VKTTIARAILCSWLFCAAAHPRQAAKIAVSRNPDNEIIVAVNPKIHLDYGLSYPLTYQIAIPANSSGLAAWRKFSATADWLRITERTANDFFNGVEAIRFDYANKIAYLSVAFSNVSDSVFLWRKK